MTLSQRIAKIQKLLKNADEEMLSEIERLLEGNTSDNTLTPEDKAIIDARLSNHHSHPNSGRDWKDIKTDLMSKYGV